MKGKIYLIATRDNFKIGEKVDKDPEAAKQEETFKFRDGSIESFHRSAVLGEIFKEKRGIFCAIGISSERKFYEDSFFSALEEEVSADFIKLQIGKLNKTTKEEEGGFQNTAGYFFIVKNGKIPADYLEVESFSLNDFFFDLFPVVVSKADMEVDFISQLVSSDYEFEHYLKAITEVPVDMIDVETCKQYIISKNPMAKSISILFALRAMQTWDTDKLLSELEYLTLCLISSVAIPDSANRRYAKIVESLIMRIEPEKLLERLDFLIDTQNFKDGKIDLFFRIVIEYARQGLNDENVEKVLAICEEKANSPGRGWVQPESNFSAGYISQWKKIDREKVDEVKKIITT